MKVSNRDGEADGRTASSAAFTINFCLCIQMYMYNIVLYYSVPSSLEGVYFLLFLGKLSVRHVSKILGGSG